jgi:UDP-2,3-diacylglucosamine pyrophosphatase LpxH
MLSSQTAPVRLILNGDVFDFLQLDGYTGISPKDSAKHMKQILHALSGEGQSCNIVDALRRFTNNGHRLNCFPGNHDPELAFDCVQEVLRDCLGASCDIPIKDGKWTLAIGGAANDLQVIGMHGHWNDPFNAINFDSLLKAQDSDEICCTMPPGSRLVLDVINPYRRDYVGPERPKRFPFIDLIPSDLAVIYSLIYLDWRLAIRRISKALDVPPHAGLRFVALALKQNWLLTDPATLWQTAQGRATDEVQNDAALNLLVNGLISCMTENERASHELVQRQFQPYFQDDFSNIQARDGVAGRVPILAGNDGKWLCRVLLRAIGKKLAKARSAFEPHKPDELAKHSIGTWGDVSGRQVVALTGHTHSAKYIRHQGGVYINTGTWQDLVRIPDDISETGIPIWLEALQNDQIPHWRRCPVARIDAGGAELFHWNGSEMVAW